jgi:hypothetical protein
VQKTPDILLAAPIVYEVAPTGEHASQARSYGPTV